MELDYKKLGLKCGLEIHQQLDTNKLFCNCPSVLRSDEPDFIVKRKLHVVAGESGEIDVAVKHEMEKDRGFIYQGYDTICLVELDEEPPHLINQEALKIALQISILLNSKIFPLTQIMRKVVIDGSNTSGFQRTILIARDGFVETSFGRVGIDTICLEEDAARIVSREKNNVVYRLDRLGIPLVEIATAPDIKTPEQAKEVALHIGNILRSCKVKRGIGTIRQDVNLSIKKGERIEIKGFQDIRNVERAIKIEIERQKKLVEEGKSVGEVRNVLSDGTTEFLRPLPGAARMYPETDLPLLKISRQITDEVRKNLPQLRGDVQKELIKEGLNEDMIRLLFKQNKLEEFREFVKVLNNPKLIAKIILVWPREISKREKISLEKVESVLEDNLNEILEKVSKKKISENEIKEILTKLVKGEDLKKAVSIKKENLNVLEERIIKLIKEKPGLGINAYMGLIMREFSGKVNGKEVRDIIERNLR
ncbi:MAG: Glu-tRNA(Gln) amidotransferase subunit GatE [Nanoarchaeota archaeon]|nr:Glu-tRNA(Gln) amidotransferase subunit GatE [Nanoarchaeota archaeon]